MRLVRTLLLPLLLILSMIGFDRLAGATPCTGCGARVEATPVQLIWPAAPRVLLKPAPRVLLMPEPPLPMDDGQPRFRL